MLHASTQQLIRKLHELTEAGGLAWKEGERETSRLETEGYIVEIEATPPGLRLLRTDGRELEKATADDLTSVAWPAGEGTYATRVAEMAAKAHRIARGAEQAIATILTSLSAPAKGPAAQPPAPTPAAPASQAVPAPPAPAPAPTPIQAVVPPVAQSAPQPAPAVEPPQPAPTPAPTAVAAAPVPTPPTPETVAQPGSEASPTPTPPEPSVPPRKPDILIQGISARSIQGVEQSSASDLQRLAPAAPKPAPQPAPAPAQAPRPQQPPPTTGPGVYKPWN